MGNIGHVAVEDKAMHWPIVSLDEVCEDLTVGHVGPMASEYMDCGVPFLRSQDVLPYRLDFENAKRIGLEFHSRLKKSRLRPGDVVIVRTGAPGTTAVVPDEIDEANCSDLVIVRPGPRLNPHYLAYFLNGRARAEINKNCVGAVQQHFNVGSARKLRLPCPPRSIQDAIGERLKAFDDKIELNRRTNQTLEEMARAIYRAWFITFLPVKAKAAGATCFPHMNDECFAALPLTMEESNAGLLPKGWSIGTTADLGRIVCGKTPPTRTPELYGGTMPFITIPDMHGQTWITQTARTLSNNGAESQPTKTVPAGSVCVSCIATPGLVSLASLPSQSNQQINSITPKSPYGRAFVYLQLKETAEEVMVRGSGGSVFHNLNTGDFSRLPILLPPQDLVRQFETIAEPYLQQILNLSRECTALAAIRDSLLAQLFRNAA